MPKPSRSLDDKEIAQISAICSEYVSYSENDDERISSVVCEQFPNLPRAYVLACAANNLRQRREAWKRKMLR